MKLLIIESTLVNYGDDTGGVHEERGNIVDVSKDTAHALVGANRALYCEAKDDPSKANINTASKDMLQAAEAARAAAAKVK